MLVPGTRKFLATLFTEMHIHATYTQKQIRHHPTSAHTPHINPHIHTHTPLKPTYIIHTYYCYHYQGAVLRSAAAEEIKLLLKCARFQAGDLFLRTDGSSVKDEWRGCQGSSVMMRALCVMASLLRSERLGVGGAVILEA